ncbi:hypothetical protein EYF80_056323 [Liparis tanakae]|uniref:Uncharacterized protein n=1 Tax=Liparis tanakae TaxID=230148 RepID=A0A4Z2EXC8_9TELE|nr:hypothetical protein EYF80_056323 [Liparis tanakae]
MHHVFHSPRSKPFRVCMSVNCKYTPCHLRAADIRLQAARQETVPVSPPPKRHLYLRPPPFPATPPLSAACGCSQPCSPCPGCDNAASSAALRP